LEPLALFILENPLFDGDFEAKLAEYIDDEKGVATIDEALQGAKDIIAEMISEHADVRKVVRESMLENSKVVSEKAKTKAGDHPPKAKDVYEVYHQFEIDITKIKPYQLLAINRGEREKFLKASFSYDKPEFFNEINKTFFEYNDSAFEEILNETVDDSFTRLIYPSIEREVRNYLTEIADLHAIEIFASNLDSFYCNLQLKVK
jgi:uncharacterized protein